MISWGYFTDHSPFEPHCNAHPNNFIVLDPMSSKGNNILGVLDFDLAYHFESFVNTVEPDPEFFTDQDSFELQKTKFGTNNREQFDDWNCAEKYELEIALGGVENMSNFTYLTKQSSSSGDEKVSEIIEMLTLCLRDTCVLYYRQAYNK
jgi:hypothetical protein